MKHIVVVGATSGIAHACARLWAKQEPALFTLVGRDPSRLEAVADDLRVRSPGSRITTQVADFESPKGIDQAVAQCFESGPADIVLVAHGVLSDQATCQDDLEACKQSLSVNGLSPVLFAEAVAKRMAMANKGVLAVIGSVAGDRGRQSNYVYGAAKGMVERYLQGLQHRFARSPVRVVLIKPGPTDTPMTAHLKAKGMRMAPVDTVAQDIVAGIAKGQRVIYTPRIWLLIMWVVRNLPYSLFSRTYL